MGRQYRAPRRGPSGYLVSPAVVSSSSTVVAIPNYGVTDVSTWTAGDYVMDTPEVGVRKTFICVSTTSAAKVIKFSTGTSVAAGMGTNSAIVKITLGESTIDQCVVLVGQNSTRWVIESAYPLLSTGAGATVSS